MKVADSQNSSEAIAGFLLGVKNCYLDKIPGAEDTEFLQEEIASRYNITITVAPESPEHLAGIIV
ncbi:hypothetical protein [Microcoleus sp. B7-D4]|uniref:hypothetical protein n=1 Tax=Microcoleus sp. B7-D4 TaxID=2818696 RepID=UPI002FD5ED41